MPKIRAASVAEHRTMQRGALLDAARELLARGGMNALTFPAMAERTGLARSSVYEYFRSRGAVVEELCRIDFPRWTAEIEAAMAAADSPEDRVEACVRSQLSLAGMEQHRAVVAISASELDAGARAQIRAAHGPLVELIVSALGELGHPRPELTAVMLQGVVQGAMRRMGSGPGAAAESEEVVAEAVAFVLGGVRRG